MRFDLLGGATAVRWLLADAFERLGHPDSATVQLEEALSDHEHTLWETHLRGIAVPFIHRRLALLYSRAGRVEDARRHWRAYAETVRTPDPEVQPLVAEARAELARLDGAPRAAPRR